MVSLSRERAEHPFHLPPVCLGVYMYNKISCSPPSVPTTLLLGPLTLSTQQDLPCSQFESFKVLSYPYIHHPEFEVVQERGLDM